MKVKTNKKLVFVIFIVLLGVIITGCTGPSARGWSGFASSDGLLYVGSMDGEILALDPSLRARGLSFPGEGEWEYAIKMPSAGGSMCGLPTCSSAASSAGVAIYATPVVSNDLVYAGTYHGRIYALNSDTGALRWVYPREGNETVGAIVGDLALDDGSVYLCSSNGKVYALDAATGDLKWEFETHDRVWASPVISGDVVYAGSYDGKLYAISSQDGKELWSKELPAAMCSSLVASQDSVFFGTFDRKLYAMGKSDARIKWEFEGGNWFWAAPLVKDNTVYAGCLDGKIYAIDVETGAQKWQVVADKSIVSRPVAVADLIVAVSESGSMYLIDSASGNIRKTISVGYAVMAPLYAIDNTVYVHTRDNYVQAVDVQAGTTVWKFKKAGKQE